MAVRSEQEDRQTKFECIKSIPGIARVPQTCRSVQASWCVALGTKTTKLVTMWQMRGQKLISEFEGSVHAHFR